MMEAYSLLGITALACFGLGYLTAARRYRHEIWAAKRNQLKQRIRGAA